MIFVLNSINTVFDSVGFWGIGSFTHFNILLNFAKNGSSHIAEVSKMFVGCPFYMKIFVTRQSQNFNYNQNTELSFLLILLSCSALLLKLIDIYYHELTRKMSLEKIFLIGVLLVPNWFHNVYLLIDN